MYVFTYFDSADIETPDDHSLPANFIVDGRICKMDPIRNLTNGKCNVHFILANNIVQGNSKLNSYLPCIAWGKVAKDIS